MKIIAYGFLLLVLDGSTQISSKPHRWVLGDSGQAGVEVCYLNKESHTDDLCSNETRQFIPFSEWCSLLRALPVGSDIPPALRSSAIHELCGRHNL